MRPNDSARTALRSATAAHHERVDRVFANVDLSNRPSYIQFLTAQAAAHIAVERALTQAGAASVVDDWPDRRRTTLIEDDLAALGAACPEPLVIGPFDSVAAILGGVYVLEGSRLGGRMLARSVPADFPRSFLDAGDSGAWRRLQTLLDTHLDSSAKLQIAIKAASDVFLLFELGGKRFLPTEASWKISEPST